MQTVITSKAVAGLPSSGGAASPGNVAGTGEDFAALVPESGTDQPVAAASPADAAPPAAAVGAFWSGWPLATATASALTAAVPTAEDGGSVPDSGLLAQPAAPGTGELDVPLGAEGAADGQVQPGAAPVRPVANRAVAILIPAAAGVPDVPEAGTAPMAVPDAPVTALPSPAAGRAAEPALAPAAPAMVAAALPRLWQGGMARVEGGTAEPKVGPEVAPVPESGGADTPDTAATAPVLQATVAPQAPAMGLAETALLSLFAAQADAAALDAGGEGGGFSALSLPASPALAPIGPGQSTPLPQLVVQVAQILSRQAAGPTEIALSPQELGHVRVTLQADAQNPDHLVVMLTFERAETLDLFRRHSDQLAQDLREAGYSGVNIGFGQSYGGDSSDAPADPTPADPWEDRSTPDPTPALLADRSALRPAPSGTLDLRL